MVPLGWDIDLQDWSARYRGWVSSGLLTARPGDILLPGDGSGNRAQTIESLRTVLPTPKGRGRSSSPCRRVVRKDTDTAPNVPVSNLWMLRGPASR